jgi:hypothetical protein
MHLRNSSLVNEPVLQDTSLPLGSFSPIRRSTDPATDGLTGTAFAPRCTR